jgi:excisionase family DNA binding protein
MEPSATRAATNEADRPRGHVAVEGRLLSPRQVAERLGCNKALVYRLVRRGELPALQLGGRGCAVRIAEADLNSWLYSDPSVAA